MADTTLRSGSLRSTSYSTVAGHLAGVRRAWKRAAGLSGLVVVLVEALGVFGVVLLVDVLYRPRLEGRMVLLFLSAAAIVYLVVRHVLRPLVRRIPDEQIALYVEEHSPGFEGALISAAEFGPAGSPALAGRRGPAGGISEQQRSIIDAIIGEAEARTRRLGLRSAVDLSRLKKYAVTAAVALAIYLVIGLLAPKTMAHHATRVLVPWLTPAEEEAAPERPAFREDLSPITFELSAGDTALCRGTPFDLEAGLSRSPRRPVLFHFRTPAETRSGRRRRPDDAASSAEPVTGEDPAWRTLTMQEIEKLHGYRVSLPDVNEDLEYYVSTGEFSSDAYRITVYDPLRLEGFEIGVRFPKYLELADELTEQPTGDVSVPEGSTVTVRILTNGRLEGGRLTWAEGDFLDLVVDKGLDDGRGASAATSFLVVKDRSYTFVVRDVNGQELPSSAPALVHAIKDSPPDLEVTLPKIDISAHPLAEVAFRVEAKDDWGVASIHLVYMLGIEGDVRPVRLPLELEPAGPAGRKAGTSVAAGHKMLFEEFEPGLRPGDMMTYHFEARDRKGQVVMSDIYFITIKPFEVWATWSPVHYKKGKPHGPVDVPSPLAKYVAAAWHLHAQKDYLSREEYARACEKLADEFVSGKVKLWDYVKKGH